MIAERADLVMYLGDTFQRLVRWETKPFVYKAITAIPNTAPATITAVGHGLTDGWRVAIIDVLGMTQINAPKNGTVKTDFQPCTYIGPDTIALNEVSASDFDAYESGGYVKFYTPVDISGYTAKMEIRDVPGGTVLATIDSGTGGITLNNTQKTILLTIDRATVEAFTFTEGFYDLQMIDPSDKETTILRGSVTIVAEVTE